MALDVGVTVIGRSSTFRGELTGEGDVQVEGVLEGTVHAPGARITVGPEAHVRALLSAQDVVVYGRVEGELRAAGRVELRSSAMVVGELFSARLAIEDGAVLHGHADCFQAAATSTGPEAAGSRGPQVLPQSTPPRENGTVAVPSVAMAPPPAVDDIVSIDEGAPELKSS